MKKLINTKYLILVAIIVISPSFVFAANVYLESSQNNITVGDTVIITVKINSETSVINTVEGDILLKPSTGNLTVQEFSLANSVFGLWPRTPSLSKDGLAVSFVAGVPGGFNIEGATIFKIIFNATKEGNITIAPQNIIAYANDGKGTKISVSTSKLVIKVNPKRIGVDPNNEWGSLLSKDNIPPEKFVIVQGQDLSMFEGKKFVFFSALDNQSGISYYEVSENGAPVVRSGSTYVLQNQSDDIKLKVTAYDKALNKRIEIYSSDAPISWLSIFVVVLLILILRMLYRKIKKFN